MVTIHLGVNLPILSLGVDFLLLSACASLVLILAFSAIIHVFSLFCQLYVKVVGSILTVHLPALGPVITLTNMCFVLLSAQHAVLALREQSSIMTSVFHHHSVQVCNC